MLTSVFQADLSLIKDLIIESGFSSDLYRNAHQDLIENMHDPSHALDHFLSYGYRENRRFKIDLNNASLLAIIELKELCLQYKALIASALLRASSLQEMNYVEVWHLILELRQFGARPLIIIGDSHSNCYIHADFRRDEWLLPVHILCSGGSAIGLNNPASRSGYGDVIRRFRDITGWSAGSGVPIVFKFGQVDTEFVYIFRRIESGMMKFDFLDYVKFCADSVFGYFSFLSQLFPPSDRSMVDIFSIFPPALSSEHWEKGYVNAHIAFLEAQSDLDLLARKIRDLEIPNLAARTKMHEFYNEFIRKAALHFHFRYVDDFSPLIGSDGVLARKFTQFSGGTDHHIDQHPSASALIPILWACVDRI